MRFVSAAVQFMLGAVAAKMCWQPGRRLHARRVLFPCASIVSILTTLSNEVLGSTYDLLDEFAAAAFVYLFGSVCLLLFIERGEGVDLLCELLMLCAGIGLHLAWKAAYAPPILLALASGLVCVHQQLTGRQLWLGPGLAMLWLGAVLLVVSAGLFGYSRTTDQHEGWALAYYNCIWAACCVLLAENRPARESFQRISGE